MKDKFVGCLLLIPFIILILFTPTYIYVFEDGRVLNVGDCCAAATTTVPNGVVLESVIRWFMVQDWRGAFLNGAKALVLVLVIFLAIVGLSFLSLESQPTPDLEDIEKNVDDRH